ncbi:MAG: KUP/HAK/KT family potassium transporter [Saprospiraceae bacterium]|nr:KUP/HAK/KT family potassium transporter [Saprospiraceae bacterium]
MESAHHRVSAASLLVTLGIVYGDIGTSPLYVLKAIVGTSVISKELILGGLSCIFWTLTLQATIKYIIITLQADNKGEGGVFSLFALIRRKAPNWVIYIAMIGCAALLADGIITPSISLTSSIEGLKASFPQISPVPIVIGILTALFTFQQFGTDTIGKFFGPIMLIWFSMLMVLGLMHLSDNWVVLQAVNPVYAFNLLTHNPNSWLIIGAVFLCVTGAEALYSDLGHVGRRNIQFSWIFVKTALLINYFGQGAWILTLEGQPLGTYNPFFAVMPNWFVPIGVGVATLASIVASQALISGSFSLINEAIKLKSWIRVKIVYPSKLKQQLFIPSINGILFVGSCFIVLYFQESHKMEAAYGIAITVAMLTTTLLLTWYLSYRKRWKIYQVILITLLFVSLESLFTIANLQKIAHGAGVTLLLGGFFFIIMIINYRAESLTYQKRHFVPLNKYLRIIEAVSEDKEIPKFASNIVYLSYAHQKDRIEKYLLKSIFQKQPKRADHYWLLHFNEVDEPFTNTYHFTELSPGKIYRLDFDLGYKIQPNVKDFFLNAINELCQKGIISSYSSYPSLKQFGIPADYLFIVTRSTFNISQKLSFGEQLIIRGYHILKRFSEPAEDHFGLDKNMLLIEYVAFK